MIDDAWKTQGSCAEHPSPDWWCSRDPERRDRALELCRSCPVQARCAEFAATSGQEWGIWGGYLFQGTKRPHRLVNDFPRAERSCAECGDRFLLRHALQRYCSAKCQRTAKRDRLTYAPRAIAPPCGTDAAYQRHKKLREPACGPCADAHRADQLERKNRQRRLRQARDIHRVLTDLGTSEVAS